MMRKMNQFLQILLILFVINLYPFNTLKLLFQKSENIYEKLTHNQNKTGITKQDIIDCQNEFQDQIKLDDYIGNGGFGVVLKGVKKNGEIVAIKLIKSQNKEQNKEFEFRKKFIDFEHIVKIIQEPKKVNKCWVLVMEYCQSDLKREINEKKEKYQCFNENEICKIIFQIFDAILEIHSKQIIHADIKPDNILFMNEIIKIADFGISIDSKNLRFYGKTMPFCPPELIDVNSQTLSKKLQERITFKIDIFSLGITLLILLGSNLLESKKTIGQYIKEQKNLDIKELGIKEEYLSLFTFIKYEMLNEDPKLRKSAIQLMKIFIDYFHTNNIKLDSEIDRIYRLIELLQEKQKQEQDINREDNLRFLYCLLALLKLDPKGNLEKSIKNIEKSKIELSDKIFLQNQYAMILIDKAQYLEAEVKIKNILKQIEQINENQQKKILEAQTMDIYVLLYYRRDSKGDCDEALKLQKKALKIRQKIYGDCHPEISLSYMEIAKINNRLGNKDKALKYDLKNLNSLKNLFNGNHAYIAKTLNSLCYQYDELKDFQNAFDCGCKAYKMIKVLKLENMLKAHCFSNLAVCYTIQKNRKKAYKYRQKSLDLRIKLCGENHPEVAIAYTTFGNTCYHFKDYKNSLIYNWKAFYIFIQNPRQSQTHFKFTFKRLCKSTKIYILDSIYILLILIFLMISYLFYIISS